MNVFRHSILLVDMRLFLPMDNSHSLFEMKHEQEVRSRQAEKDMKSKEVKEEPGQQVMEHIKELLKLKKKKEQKPVFVPQVLNDIIDDLKQYVEQTGVVVTEIKNIQYGKKMRFALGLKQAELNLFFGKKGFSVIVSPRTGTDEGLNQLMVDLVSNYINER